MRLRSTIFLWTLLATGLPLLGLTLVLLSWSEQRYLDEFDREINGRLNALGTEIDNHLAYEREVIRGIAQSAAMQEFLPVARAANEGARHPDYLPLKSQLTQFLLTLQRTIPGLGSLRVLDGQGNTLIKVTDGKVHPSIYRSLGSVEYAEEELMEPGFTRNLRLLPTGDISFVQLPQSRWDLLTGQTLTMLTALVPLGEPGRPAAVLAINTFGEYLDRILRLVPRPPGAELLIAERNLDDSRRNGLLLYHDRLDTRFSTPKPHEVKLQSTDQAELWEHMKKRPFGVFSTRNGHWRIYYQEYHPYPNQLTGWVLAFAIPSASMHGPYAGLRQALWLLVLLAFAASALLALLGSRHIARPILRLREALRDFASNPTRRVEEQSRTNEIRELETDFNRMADRLRSSETERRRAERRAMQQAKLASIGQMAAGIGHEINNPLNNILSLSTLIERGLPRAADNLREDVHDLRDEALRAGRIVRGVMNFARQLPPEHQPFRVCPWLNETVSRLDPEAMAADVHFDLTSCAPECVAEADPDQLQQVLLNLLQNALHASPAGAHIQVTGACFDGRLRVCVRDSGPGVPPEVLARIFDPFFTTKGVGEGTGLGLSISLGIVQYHGGTLSIRNREDASGVEACFEVPLTPSSPRFAPPEDSL